ncbi:MAG TPA: DUF1080 domain-containing protein [Fimbriiglobus sp.]|jgi:hypothetical protein
MCPTLFLLTSAILGPSAPPPPLVSEDTASFLKPENWEGLPNLWTNDGKTIVGETKQDPKFNTFYCTKTKYTDFDLSFKVLMRDGVGNSGVQIRSRVLDDEKSKGKFVAAGPQCDMGQQYWGSLYGEKFGKDGKSMAGHMMQACPNEFVAKHVKTMEFNDYSIHVKGKHVTIKMNGATSVDGDFDILPADGIIALQIHAGFPKMRVEFKDFTFVNHGK